MISTRTKARLAASAVVVGGVLSTAIPAHALLPSPAADAYVVSATAFGNFLAVPATPHSTYPSGGTQTVVGLNAGPFATSATLTATTSGDPATGVSHASATVQQLGVSLPLGASLALTGVNSTCDATPTAAATGSGTIATGSVTLPIGSPITLAANAAPNTAVTVPGIASIVLNEQTTDSTTGVLTVNAVHITLLPAVGGADIVIGHAQCGAAAPSDVNPVPMISTPVAAGAAATAAVGGVVMLRRRNRKQGVSAS